MGLCSAIYQPGNNGKNQHVWALGFGIVGREWRCTDNAVQFGILVKGGLWGPG